MNNLEFTKDLIKGRIAEIIFEQMFRGAGEFTIIRFGYEYTSPELVQYQHQLKIIKSALDNIRHAPDFVLLSNDKTQAYLVEVKFMMYRNAKKISDIAKKTVDQWNPSWLFVASPDGFFFDDCHSIVRNNGKLNTLEYSWIPKNSQEGYLSLLSDFTRCMSEIKKK